jgi:hypothetical protein
MRDEDSNQLLSSYDCGGNTPFSSTYSDINKSEDPDGLERSTPLLPNPFLPPSLSRQESPRELPSALCTPQVSLERAYPRINTQDMYVYSLEITTCQVLSMVIA